MSDSLRVTLGLRYTEEDKDQYIIHPNASVVNVPRFDAEGSDSWDNTSAQYSIKFSKPRRKSRRLGINSDGYSIKRVLQF